MQKSDLSEKRKKYLKIIENAKLELSTHGSSELFSLNVTPPTSPTTLDITEQDLQTDDSRDGVEHINLKEFNYSQSDIINTLMGGPKSNQNITDDMLEQIQQHNQDCLKQLKDIKWENVIGSEHDFKAALFKGTGFCNADKDASKCNLAPYKYIGELSDAEFSACDQKFSRLLKEEAEKENNKIPLHARHSCSENIYEEKLTQLNNLFTKVNLTDNASSSNPKAGLAQLIDSKYTRQSGGQTDAYSDSDSDSDPVVASHIYNELDTDSDSDDTVKRNLDIDNVRGLTSKDVFLSSAVVHDGPHTSAAARRASTSHKTVDSNYTIMRVKKPPVGKKKGSLAATKRTKSKTVKNDLPVTQNTKQSARRKTLLKIDAALFSHDAKELEAVKKARRLQPTNPPRTKPKGFDNAKYLKVTCSKLDIIKSVPAAVQSASTMNTATTANCNSSAISLEASTEELSEPDSETIESNKKSTLPKKTRNQKQRTHTQTKTATKPEIVKTKPLVAQLKLVADGSEKNKKKSSKNVNRK